MTRPGASSSILYLTNSPKISKRVVVWTDGAAPFESRSVSLSLKSVGVRPHRAGTRMLTYADVC